MAKVYFADCVFFQAKGKLDSYQRYAGDHSVCTKDDHCSACKRTFGRAHPNINKEGCPSGCKDFSK